MHVHRPTEAGENLCCEQVLIINIFTSFITGQLFEISHQLTCKSHSLIYLPQCREFLLQFVGKSEIDIKTLYYQKTLKLKVSYCLIKSFNMTVIIFRLILRQPNNQDIHSNCKLKTLPKTERKFFHIEAEYT